MWFGNFKHNVYQVTTFHVRLTLGKEEVQQMRVKVWHFRSLCPVGLRWGFISKIVPLNSPKLGAGISSCSPAGNGKHGCWKRSFAIKCSIPSYQSHLCLWRQVSPVGVKPSRSQLLCPQTCFIFGSPFPHRMIFFFLINICKNVGKHFCAYLSMNSTHGLHQALFSLPLWCILTTHVPGTEK